MTLAMYEQVFLGSEILYRCTYCYALTESSYFATLHFESHGIA